MSDIHVGQDEFLPAQSEPSPMNQLDRWKFSLLKQRKCEKSDNNNNCSNIKIFNILHQQNLIKKIGSIFLNFKKSEGHHVKYPKIKISVSNSKGHDISQNDYEISVLGKIDWTVMC